MTHDANQRKAEYDRDQIEIESYDAQTRRIAAMATAVSTFMPPVPSQTDLPQ
jgi:hypothetical protein